MSSLFAEILDKIDQVPVRRTDVQRLLGKTEHDLQAAENEEATDWIIKKVHEAILNGCTAVMAAQGYRAKLGSWHHYATIRFAQLGYPSIRDYWTVLKCCAGGATKSRTGRLS